MWFYLTLLIAFVLLTVLFCVLELSLLLLHRLRLRVFESEGSRTARLLIQILRHERLARQTLFIGMRLSVTAVAATTYFLGANLGLEFWPRRGLEASVLFALLLLVEFVPRWVVPSRPTRTLLFFAYPYGCFFVLLMPLTLLYDWIVRLSESGSERRRKSTATFPVREDLRQLISRPELAMLGERETEMAIKFLEFGATLVRDVMTPFSKVQSLDSQATVGNLFDKVREVGFTRVPILSEDRQHFVGLVNIHDVLHETPETKLQGFLRPIPQVHSNSLAHSIFVYLQRNPSWMASVETQGRCIGIVTVEDLVEEVLGEIYDEFETPPVD